MKKIKLMGDGKIGVESDMIGGGDEGRVLLKVVNVIF